MSSIDSILILGGGSAGLIAALTIRRMMPGITVDLVRSKEIGVIGVGEGTTAVFPEHFFEVLGIPREDFYRETNPTWKQGIKFIWGPRDHFFYTFDFQFDQQRAGMEKANGFYAEEDCSHLNLASALIGNGKAFATSPLGKPLIKGHYAFHIENHTLVTYLEKVAIENGVIIHEDTFEKATQEEDRITGLAFRSGTNRTADLYIDCSGFRAELISGTLGVGFKPFTDVLFCDKAVIGGWTRTDEPLHAYTTAETMDCGWCWQIEHENWINRGYVYSSRFISDEDALAELLAKNPKISNKPRIVPFKSGRYDRSWVGNVLSLGNASGFVEPLEATALGQLIYEVRWFVELMGRADKKPGAATREEYNGIIGRAWDEMRDFLAYHYKFNTRLDTTFWRFVRENTSLGDFEAFYQAYRRLGPSPETMEALPHIPNIYGIEGYLAMLVGMQVPHDASHTLTDAERHHWERHQRNMNSQAKAGLDSENTLAAIRSPHWRWS